MTPWRIINPTQPDGQAIIAEAVGSSVEDLQTAFTGVKFYSLAENQKALSSDFSATIQGCGRTLPKESG